MKKSILEVITLISILLLISCTENKIDNSNNQIKIERIDLVENNRNVTICSDTKFYYRQINKLYLCIESDSKLSEINFLDMDLSELTTWNIYMENRSRCDISSDLCSENSCSQKLLPVSGTVSVKRNEGILTFSFSDSRWISDGVEMGQGEYQFSIDI